MLAESRWNQLPLANTLTNVQDSEDHFITGNRNLDSLIALSSAITNLLTQQLHSGSTQWEDYPPFYDNLHLDILCLKSGRLVGQTQFSQQERNRYEKAIYLREWIYLMNCHKLLLPRIMFHFTRTP